MSKLKMIKETVQQVAEAITDVIGVETEIIDDLLNIIGGTGRYYNKIGEKEEQGNPDSGLLYARILKTGEEWVIPDSFNEPLYGAVEDEIAEVCCPIILSGEIIGLMGLVAFNEEQRSFLLINTEKLLVFLRRMAFLIASRVEAVISVNSLAAILESINEGIISVDNEGYIINCNRLAEQLLDIVKDNIIGENINVVLPSVQANDIKDGTTGFYQKEIVIYDKWGYKKQLLSTITAMSNDTNDTIGAVISFREATEVSSMIYHLSEKKITSSFEDLISESKIIKDLIELGKKVALTNSTILITGESGTGKSLLARAIHFSSLRKENPFITINCAAIPDTLLESELFGYESGAFTGAKKGGKPGKFELAQGGSIFLDEIGDIPLHLQVKLLHVLQKKEIERVGGNDSIKVDVRVIAATNRNLERMMKDGEFREDLFYRLNVIPLSIPPLRKRKEDIEVLLKHSLIKYNNIIGKRINGFDLQSEKFLLSYSWPGNIRELENTIEYAVNMETGSYINLDSLPPRLKRGDIETKTYNAGKLSAQLNIVEKEIISNVLMETGYTVSGKIEAAKKLGISESTLYRRIKELNIKSN